MNMKASECSSASPLSFYLSFFLTVLSPRPPCSPLFSLCLINISATLIPSLSPSQRGSTTYIKYLKADSLVQQPGNLSQDNERRRELRLLRTERSHRQARAKGSSQDEPRGLEVKELHKLNSAEGERRGRRSDVSVWKEMFK